MPFDRFLISPLKTGLQTDLRRWMVMDDAFTELQNAYVFRGRLVKRFGTILMGPSQYLSRLRIALTGGSGVGATDGSGDATGTVPGTVFSPGQAFTIGSQIFTVQTTGTPVTMLNNTGVGTGTYNTSTGAYVFTGVTASTQIYFYPGLPVMGITQYEVITINNHPTLAFDPLFAYIFTPNSGWGRSGTAQWNGNNTNYFWSSNWQSSPGFTTIYVTNFNATVGAGSPSASDDPIWYANGPSNNLTWVAMLGSSMNGIFFLPKNGAPYSGSFVQTARIIVPFHGRLVLLNTIENDNSSGTGTGTATAYPQRARYSFLGNPLAVNAWYEGGTKDSTPTFGAGASFTDAYTDEQIISAEFVKDRLIVYFERSTWELAYTGNQVKPFQWNKLNTELGSQSTFSTVAFDKQILTVGNTGIHACNGSNVERIDDLIPDEIFDDFSAEPSSVIRTQGIRDYQKELVYWTFLTDYGATSKTYPDQIMVYNYKNGAWAFNDDCLITFGYFEQQTDTTWASSIPTTWEQYNGNWSSGVAANQRQIVAGTPEGFVLIIDPDQSRNAASAQITNMTVNGDGTITLLVYSNNLSSNTIEYPADGDFVLIENVSSLSSVAAALNNNIFAVYSVNADGNNFTITTNDRYINGALQPNVTSGTYAGGGTIARVSNMLIETKQFNPYDKEDRNVFLHRVDFAVQRTGMYSIPPVIGGGQITVDYYPSSSSVSLIEGGTASTAIMGNSILETSPYNPSLYPLEQYQEMLWHPIYFQSTGTNIQLSMSLSSIQMINPIISLAEFELEGMILYTERSSARLQ